MSKGLVKVDSIHTSKSRTRSPIHLHISEDAPVHLHFERGSNYASGIIKPSTENMTNKVKQSIPPYQTPWIPPPAKTSSGRPLPDGRRVRLASSIAAESVQSDRVTQTEPECVDTLPIGRISELDGARNRFSPITEEVDVDTAPRSTKCPTPDPVHSRLAGQLTHFGDQSERKNFDVHLEDGALWTSDVTDEWIRDIDNSMTQVARAVRKLEEGLEELVYEGRRLSKRDVARIIHPRDDLILHAEVAVRAGRELCRWASSARQQNDQFLARRLSQTQSREAALTAEVRQLREKLDRTMIELEATRQQLSSQQDETMKFNTVNESLESVKGHLQRELRLKESECGRLSIQVRNLNSRLAQERATFHTRLQASEAAMEQLRETKEAVKRVARSQKRRAERAEQELADALERLSAKEAILAQFQGEGDEPQRLSSSRNPSEERKALQQDPNRVEHVRLNRSISRQSGSEQAPSRDTSLCNAFGHNRLSQSQLEEENERLRTTAANCEQRLMSAEHEMEELRANLANCEAMLNTYHGDSENQAEQLQLVRDQLKKAEEARQRSEEQLCEIEARLQDAEAHNQALMNALEQGGFKQSGIGLARSDQQGLTALLTKHDSDKDQASVLKELHRQLNEARNERESAERRAEVRLADLRAQLTQADATNRSLQAYLTFLKRSYASVFQPDLAPLTPSAAYATLTVPVKTVHTGGGESGAIGAETPNLSGLSPHVLPADKHRS